MTKKAAVEKPVEKEIETEVLEAPAPEAQVEESHDLAVVHPSLKEKLFNIQKQLCDTGVSKDGKGSQYATRSIDVLIGAMSEKFSQNRVVLQPEIEDVSRSIVELNSGKKQNCTIVKIRYHFLDIDSDETLSTVFYGEASDSLDKSLQQAITNCYKYLMIQHFQIPVSPMNSDPDTVQSEEEHDAGGEGVKTVTAQLLTPEDLAGIRDLIARTGTDEAQFCKFLKTESLEKLPLVSAAGAITALRQKEKSQSTSKVTTPQAAAVMAAMNGGTNK